MQQAGADGGTKLRHSDQNLDATEFCSGFIIFIRGEVNIVAQRDRERFDKNCAASV